MQLNVKEVTLPDPVEISIDVDTSAHSCLLVLWDLDLTQLKVERYADCPASWQPHKVCGKDLILTQANCDYVFYLPGRYRLSTVDGSPIPDSVKYEKIMVTRETAQLYFAEKKACCCE